MKKYTLLVALFISFLSFSQNETISSTQKNNPNSDIESFVYDINGLSPKSISVQLKEDKGKDKDLYPKIVNWIKEKYGDGIEISGNKNKIKIKGLTYNAICYGVSNYKCKNMIYDIEITLKKKEYIFKPFTLSYLTGSINNPKENIINLNESDFYKANGTIKKRFINVPSQIETLFNDLNKSLYTYLNDNPQFTEW
ncbi:hypothetical protein L3X39_00960 [Sabulilitoribacter multivorans]|uniref:DUF4468 domain-containing protein n=1 Tax=Flaviramulus multivorans TaxID=1304750 RepID=A0ABS9IF80_9FLAO|nr:hypothetical protein [Flaviramulus multivorans]MCF7559191.1 hypothetical protein [Flaviramulus multivorans]